jgi:hypothetical protein
MPHDEEKSNKRCSTIHFEASLKKKEAGMKKLTSISRTILLFAASLSGICAGATVTVGPGSGYDFTGIQAAINSAVNGDQIIVAAGTYSETINFNGKRLHLYSSAGPEVTIINGTGHYHVVQCVSGEGPDTILEGFTITGGNANGSAYPDASGGGMFTLNSSPTVIGCIFTANAASGDGGGIYNQSGSPIVTNCTFSNNTASSGAAMYNLWSSPIVAGCTFSENAAGFQGGGIYNYQSNPAVTNCIFSGNSANQGGGMYSSSSSPIIKQCLFSGNSATASGGGMFNSYSSSVVTNCLFTGNLASSSGGGTYNHSGSPSFTNCVIIGNSTGSFGGAMFNTSSSAPVLVNCTLTRNSGKFGCGIVNWSSTPSLKNCIVWGNLVQYGYAQIHNDSGSTTTVTYSNIQGGYSGTGNKNVDPLFVNAAGGNARLSAGSLCINAGSNAAVPAGVFTDLDGNVRMVNAVDMGAYEFSTGLPAEVHNVTQDLYYLTIQAAINNAAQADWIEVPPGTYNLPINFLGRAVRLYSSDGPQVTIINAAGRNCSVVVCENGERANTILEGFTLTGGNATGGGMLNRNSSPTVKNCIIRNNASGDHGGGMYNHSASPTVTNCTFSQNTAGLHGGGMMNNVSSSPTVVNSVFSQNTAGAGGGGMANSVSCSPLVSNCTFNNNASVQGGGGMYNYFSSPTVTNCIVWANSPDQLFNEESSSAVSYSNIQNGFSGTGNISADPQFADPVGGDLRLLWFSASIDAGNNAAVPAGVTTDLAGSPRIADGKGSGTAGVDMGAYEYPQCESLGLSLQITLAPEEAVSAAAAWRLAGQEAWLASGQTLRDLAPGYYKVEFRELDAWFEPNEMWVCVMRDLPIVETAAYKPVGTFDIGQIPSAGVPHGSTLAFYVYSLLGPEATLAMAAQPQGQMTFDPQTGLFVYRPGAGDVLAFDVVFTATLEDQIDEQVVTISPIANLPEEYAFVSAPLQNFPDDQSRDYLVVSEIASDNEQMLNGLSRTVRSVTIAGKTVAFQAGHANGLYQALQQPGWRALYGRYRRDDRVRRDGDYRQPAASAADRRDDLRAAACVHRRRVAGRHDALRRRTRRRRHCPVYRRLCVRWHRRSFCACRQRAGGPLGTAYVYAQRV